MDKQPWIEKYRPTTPDNIVYHKNIKKAFRVFFKEGNLPNMLLVGSAGVGKTSTIMAFAKEFYGDMYGDMVMVINASEDRGIEVIRGKVQQFSKSNCYDTFKLIILDEVDSMTQDAQYVLRKIVEQHTARVRFCFVCNYIKKINLALQSRCCIVKFRPIPDKYLKKIGVKICCDEEMVTLTENSLDLIVRCSGGDMRKMINILQCVKLNNVSKLRQVSKLLIMPSGIKIQKILEFFKNNGLCDSVHFLRAIVGENGYSLLEMVKMVYSILLLECCKGVNVIKNANILKKLAIINVNLCSCGYEDIQLHAFVAIFYL